MLRRFNSLIKVPKAQQEPTEHAHLRPAFSVDSASLRPHNVSYGEALDSFHVPEEWVRGAEPGVGQTSNSHRTNQGGDLQEDKLPITQVNTEVAVKDGKEYTKLESDDAARDFRKQLLPVNKSGYEHLDPCDTSLSRLGNVDSSISELAQRAGDKGVETAQLESQSEKEFAFPMLPLPNRIGRMSSNTTSCAVGDQVESGFTTIDISDHDTVGKPVNLAHVWNGFAGRVGGPDRTISNFSTDSMVECCRICQQHTEEQVIELGCFCRGELAKAHRSCIDQWFSNKGTNKCEVCQHAATNITPPSTLPMPHFWVWRIGGNAMGTVEPPQTGAQRVRVHTLWAALAILIAGLLFDILLTVFIGATAIPVNIIIGVMVFLGLATVARLMLDRWQQRAVRRNIQRMEIAPRFDGPYSISQSTQIQTQTASLSPPPPPPTTTAPSQVPQDLAAVV